MKKGTILKTHLREETVLSRPSTQTEVEVEDVAQAKEVVVVVEIRIKANINNSKHKIRRDQTHVDTKTIEARGVREVAEISKEIMLEMITGNVGLVVEQVTFRMTIRKKIKVVEDNRITMH